MTYTPSDYRAAGVRAVKCTARTHAGKPCKMWAARGATVCKMHGGAAPQVKAAARRRLEQATDALAAKLLGIALDDGASEAVRLAAIRDALDRGGVSAKTAGSVEVGTPAYVEVFDALVSTPVTSAAEEPLAISTEPTGGPLRPAQSAVDERTDAVGARIPGSGPSPSDSTTTSTTSTTSSTNAPRPPHMGY